MLTLGSLLGRLQRFRKIPANLRVNGDRNVPWEVKLLNYWQYSENALRDYMTN